MFFLVCGLVVLRKSSSERVFQDARPWLLVVILCPSTFNIDDEFDFGTIVRINWSSYSKKNRVISHQQRWHPKAAIQ